MSGLQAGSGNKDLDMDHEYGDGRFEGEAEIPWKIPVAAAIIGALAVAIFVIYAIVVGPTVDDAEDVGSGSPDVVTPQPSDSLPPGYVPVTNQIGARVESVDSSSVGTVVAVSTAVPGSIDPATVSRLDVAYWELVTPDGSLPMAMQNRWPNLANGDGGYVSVGFPPGMDVTDSELVSYIVGSVDVQTIVVELPPDFPVTITDFRIDLGDGRWMVVESMTITPDGGSVAWRIEGGMTARLDVFATFATVGGESNSPMTLLPEYARGFAGRSTSESGPVPLPYQFRSQYRLVGNGDGDAGSGVARISVEFRIAAVTSVTDPVALSVTPGL